MNELVPFSVTFHSKCRTFFPIICRISTAESRQPRPVRPRSNPACIVLSGPCCTWSVPCTAWYAAVDHDYTAVLKKTHCVGKYRPHSGNRLGKPDSFDPRRPLFMNTSISFSPERKKYRK